MWPQVGPLRTYGIVYLLSLVLHFVIAWRTAKALGLKRRIGIAVSLCYVIGMIVGAKFLFHWKYVGFDPLVIFRYRDYVNGGMWGGMLAYIALAGLFIISVIRQKRAGLDLVALALPMPWALGKIGCLLNGCCNGRPTSLPWAVTLLEGSQSTHIGVPVHPSQIYEVILMIVIMLLLRILNNEQWRGTLLFWFICVYGIGRTAIDISRGATNRYITQGPITGTQVICLVSAVLSLVLLVIMKRWHANAEQRKC